MAGQLFEYVTKGKGTGCLMLAVNVYSQIQMPHMDTFHCQARLTRSRLLTNKKYPENMPVTITPLSPMKH